MIGAGFFRSFWEKLVWESVRPQLDPKGVLTQSVHGVEGARKVRAARGALFLDSEGSGEG